MMFFRVSLNIFLKLNQDNIELTLVPPTDIKSDVNLLVHTHYRQRENEILEWLTPISYALKQTDYIAKRQPETGQWFLDTQEYKTWLDTRGQVLLCQGIPGAGKTIMAATIIDDLYARFQYSMGVGIAYLFCDVQRHHEQKAEDLGANLLKQLAQRTLDMPDSLVKLYERYKDIPKRPNLNELLATLGSVIKIYSRVFIIIDALDECPASEGSRARLLSAVINLKDNGASILLTSRFDPEIAARVKDAVSLEIRAKHEDIERYIIGHMDRLPSFVSSNPSLQESIKIAIENTFDGMYV